MPTNLSRAGQGWFFTADWKVSQLEVACAFTFCCLVKVLAAGDVVIMGPGLVRAFVVTIIAHCISEKRLTAANASKGVP